MTASNRRVPWAAIVIAIGLVTGFATMVLGARSVDVNADPYRYGAMASSLLRGEGFPHQEIQRRGPMYSFLIAGIYLVFGEHEWAVHLVQVLLFAATVWLVFDLGRRLFNVRTGIIAGVITAIHPLFLRYVSSLHLETFLTFLFTLMVWFTVRFRARPSLGNGVAIGLTAGLASLVKAIGLLYPGLFALGLFIEAWKARGRTGRLVYPWVPVAATFLVMAAVIAPWTIRNYKVMGHFVPVSTGTGDAILRSYIFSRTEYITLREPPYTGAENASNDLFRSLAREAGTEWQKDDWETEQFTNKAAKKKMLAEPGAFVKKTVIGLFTFWYQMTSLKNSLVVGVAALGAWIFALIGWRQARKGGIKVWPLLLPAIYLNILLALLLALGRYSAPVLPGVLVVAAYGLDTILARRRPTRAVVP
ncbi:MAG TPA: glycosyltransferase family 39 protein [Polyangia bacterium]|nr:glycosyltransferase family 39 protein [Polyangia bacterium]